MGTSGSSRGPGSNSALVPTWLTEPAVGPLPGADNTMSTTAPGGDGAADGPAARASDDTSRHAIQLPPVAARFGGARANFTTFASSGGGDRRALRRAVRDYVRSGARGSGNAVRRMGSSRATASGALGVFRGFQRDGVADTLLRLNLGDLVGRSTRDVFIGLTDVVCRDGGPIDEAIARDAWLETCAELERFGIANLDALTSDQVREVFLTFVVHAVQTKLFQDIGVNGFRVADLNEIEAFEAQFRSYIERAVRDSFTSDLTQLSSLSDQQIKSIVDQTYRDAWELFETWGDQEG
jgi:hypothetical protein